MTLRIRGVAARVVLSLLLSGAARNGWCDFTAYNDIGFSTGQLAYHITTNSPLTVVSGPLVDFSSGDPLSAHVSITMSATPGDGRTTAAAPLAGSEAANVFSNKVSCDGYTYWASEGSASIHFTGLKSSALYSFVLFMNRGSEDVKYSNRWADVVLSGAASFTNKSSDGAARSSGAMSNDTTRLTMANGVGRVFRYDGINPGADGDILFTVTPGGDPVLSQGTNAYLNCFMLQETGAPPVSSDWVWRRAEHSGAIDYTGCWFYLYISNNSGRVYLDDLQVVAGTTPESGANLAVNGGFEAGTNGWEFVGEHAASVVTSERARGGNSSLLLQASGASAGGSANSVKQLVSGFSAGGTYTYSFWYLATNSVDFVARFSAHPDMTMTVDVPAGGTTTNEPVTPTNEPPAEVLLPPVIVNEVMPYNRYYTNDPANGGSGGFDGWVELHNTTSSNIDLTGWRLSDDFAQPAKYVIPAGKSVSAGGYRLVWCDNETGQNSAGNDIHAGFKLKTSRSSVALYNAAGGLVDWVGYGSMWSDTSVGRLQDSTDLEVCESDWPTPRQANNMLGITNVVAEGGGLKLGAALVRGQRYRVETIANLGSTNWQAAATNLVGAGAAFATNLAMTGSCRFYRLVREEPVQDFIVHGDLDAAVYSALHSGADLARSATVTAIKGGGNSLTPLTDGECDFGSWVSTVWEGTRLRFSWSSPQTLDRVWIWGTSVIFTGVNQGRLIFSDGTIHRFGSVPGRWKMPGLEVAFAPRTVDWVEIELTGSFNGRFSNKHGIGEIAMFNGSPAGVGRTSFAPYAWTNEAPAGNPFTLSTSITGLVVRGPWANYMGADTWYPSWSSDNDLYSPFADGNVNDLGLMCFGATPQTGNVHIRGDYPTDLEITPLGAITASGSPWEARYPAGTLVYNGVWYYGTYVCNSSSLYSTNVNGTNVTIELNWPILGPCVGFRTSTDSGQTWTETTHTPSDPLFQEERVAPSDRGLVKLGTPHWVDFGQNMQYSPDGKAYLVGHGATSADTSVRPANCSWICGDSIYMGRVTPSLATINDRTQWEYFAGLSGTNASWTSSFSAAQPIWDWNNHCGCATITYNPGLKKYLLCVTDGRWTCRDMDTYIMESNQVYGPWKLVVYMKQFGSQGYFVHVPSKFISEDGKTMWLSWSSNFAGWTPDAITPYDFRFDRPENSQYSWNLAEVQLLTNP